MAIAAKICAPRTLRALALAAGVALFLLTVAAAHPDAWAVTPESPEVLALVDKGLSFLDSHTEDKLGGKCLIALAYHKRGLPDDHPKIREAVVARFRKCSLFPGRFAIVRSISPQLEPL